MVRPAFFRVHNHYKGTFSYLTSAYTNISDAIGNALKIRFSKDATRFAQDR